MVEHEYQRFARTQLAGSGRARWSAGILETASRDLHEFWRHSLTFHTGLETLDAGGVVVPGDEIPTEHEPVHAALHPVPITLIADRDHCVFQGRGRQGFGHGAYWMGPNGGRARVGLFVGIITDMLYNLPAIAE